MLTTMQRLAKARELSVVGAFVATAPDIKRQVLLKRRVAGLRAVLLGRRANSAEDLDLFNPDESVGLISAHLDSINDAPLDDQGRAAAYLHIVADYIRWMGQVAKGPTLINSQAMPDLLRRLESLREYARTPGYREAAYLKFRDAGSQAHRLKSRASVLLAAAQDVERQAKENTAERWAALEAEKDRRAQFTEPFKTAYMAAADALFEYRKANMRSVDLEGLDIGEVERRVATEEHLLSARTAARVAYDAEYEKQYAGLLVEPEPDTFNAMREVTREALDNVGHEFIALALAASPVSEVQAMEWASAQEISPSGRAKLKKLTLPSFGVVHSH